MKKKFKKFLRYFKISYLKAEVAQMGFNITLGNIFTLVGVLIFAAFITGVLLRLDPIYCVVLALFFICSLPMMIITHFKADFEKMRFNEAVNYMEQLIYAFHKSNKIREALVDVHNVSTGNIKRVTDKMINIIDNDMTTSKIYEKALGIMQEEYDCSRMLLLHNYLLEVEYNGGESDRSLNMLLTDIREWSSRILQYQQERKSVKGKIVVSILLAMLSCGLMVNMIPADYLDQMVPQAAYQLGTLGVLLACIVLYIMATARVGVSYLDFETDKETTKRALEDMKYISKYNKKNHVKPAIIKVCVMAPLIFFAVWYKVYWIILPVALLMLYVVFMDGIRKNQAVHHVVREVNKMFPAWIRSLVLQLQTENTHMAIVKSVDTCPVILKDEVCTLLDNIDKDPNSMRPYNEFLKDFDTPDLKMSVHYLYSISQFGTEDMLAQLDYLIEQNSQLSIAEEKLRNEDSLAGFSTLTLLPMLFAVLKLLLDLMLFLQISTTFMQNNVTLPF
jgi:hypothetical protein